MLNKNIDSKRIIAAAVFVLILFMLVTTIGKAISNKKVTERDGYKVVRDVQGIEFQVKKEYSDYSTAVLEISKNIDFSDYQTYSYKDGKDTYLLFNMSSYIIIAKRGTEFDFQNSEVKESLAQNSINGIWFEPSGKNPVIESSADKYAVSVMAQVVITPLVYNDFQGTLTTITDGEDEWSLFAGTVRKAADTYIESMEYTSSSIISVEVIEDERSEYAIVDNISSESDPHETDEEALSIDTEEIPVLEIPPSLDATEQVSENEDQNDNMFHLNENQMSLDLEQGNVYESSPYSMLEPGYASIASVMSDNGGGYTDVYLRIEHLYTEEETKNLIREHIASGESYYSEMEAPEGTHFESVSYSIKYFEPSPSYVNIKLCGLDGEDLRHRGIIYSHETYDINGKVREIDGWSSGHICFYAVPNGCSEYALSCGPGPEKEDQHSSYFHIKRESER